MPHARKGPLRCPYCSNTVAFSVYVVSYRVVHVRQVATLTFKRTVRNPPKLDTHTALLVCAACAYPLGTPPRGLIINP